jgi:hypothetical protein
VSAAKRGCIRSLRRDNRATHPSEEDEPVIRHWMKIMLLSLLVLIQTACPKLVVRQGENSPVHTEDNSDGG